MLKSIWGALLLAASCLFVCPLWAQSDKRMMCLDELFALADTESKAIKIYEAAVQGAEDDISVARNAYLPEIVFSASASYNGDAWVSDRDFSNGQTFASPHFGNSFALEAAQVIFAGGSIRNNVEAMKIRKEIAECDLAAGRQEIYFLLTGYYLDLYKYRNLLQVYERGMDQTRRVIADMQAREAAGVALDNDITRYEVQYQNLLYMHTELQSSVDICNDKLVTMLELPEMTEICPDTTLLSLDLPRRDETEYQELASSNSPLLNRNRLSLDLLDRQEKVFQSEYMPRISIIAGDNLKGPVTYEIPVLDNNINTWYVGVGLTFDFGSLYRTPKKLSRLNSSRTCSLLELDMNSEKVELGVRDAYIRYLDSYELLKTQEKSLQLARDNYDVIFNRYSNDLVLVTDLVDADNLRLSAEVQYENARINLIYNYFKLIYATGSFDSMKTEPEK